jgi:hypothetical protein
MAYAVTEITFTAGQVVTSVRNHWQYYLQTFVTSAVGIHAALLWQVTAPLQ